MDSRLPSGSALGARSGIRAQSSRRTFGFRRSLSPAAVMPGSLPLSFGHPGSALTNGPFLRRPAPTRTITQYAHQARAIPCVPTFPLAAPLRDASPGRHPTLARSASTRSRLLGVGPHQARLSPKPFFNDVGASFEPSLTADALWPCLPTCSVRFSHWPASRGLASWPRYQ